VIVQKGPCQLPIIVVDEIGKMELFSSEFEQAVSQLLSHTSVTLLGTIPQKRAIAVKFADKVRSSPTVHLFEVRMFIVFLSSDLYLSVHVSTATDVIEVNISACLLCKLYFPGY